MRTFTTISVVFLALAAGCAVGSDGDRDLTKEEAAALGGKGDYGEDYCLAFGWYGDGICDPFCLKPDPDCEQEGECRKTGCSSHVCADEDVFTTCEARPDDVCYQNATCERLDDGACGFTPSPELQACLDAVHGTTTDVWLTYTPTQCGSNPWEMDPQQNDSFWLPGELGAIVAYYASIGVSIDEIGLLDPPEPPIVCAACQCPRGDRLVVKASGANVVLLEALGFARLEGALGTEPVQCGDNPWEGGQIGSPAGEKFQVVQWAKGLGAELAELGFAYTVELMAVCAACQCPRGDLLMVLPEDDASTSVLESVGFSAL
jgi:hypothetical protein